jgi:hypothetical protein
VPARSKKAAKGGSNLKAFYGLLGLIAAIGLGAIAWAAMRSGDAVNEPVELPPEALNNPQQLVAAAVPVVAGASNAPIQLLVFSDFTCPSCRHFTQNVETPLRAEFVEKNQVQFKYYDFISRSAAAASIGGAFWRLARVAARAIRTNSGNTMTCCSAVSRNGPFAATARPAISRAMPASSGLTSARSRSA